MAIIITKHEKRAKKIDKSRFIDEDNLQNFIYENPDSIPLYEIDENIRLLILAREFPTNSGNIDALGIDENGELYIIETKLYKNPDKRLVVAQVLDYGASLSVSYNDKNDFFQILETKVNQHFNIGLSQKICDFFGYSNEATIELINILKYNLINGKFRFVVLMDKLEKRLRDLILFLNRNSRFDIYGVELEFYKYDDFEITIPKLFGAEIKKEINITSTTSNRKPWNEESFFEEIKNNLLPEETKVIEKLYEFSKEYADKISWGTGIQRGSFNPIVSRICPRSLFTLFSDGTLYLNYAWINENDEQKEYQKKYIRLLGEIFELPIENGKAKYPKYPIVEWGKKAENLKKKIIELIED